MTRLPFIVSQNVCAIALLFMLATPITSFGVETPSPIALRMGVLSPSDMKHMRQVEVYFERLADSLPKNALVFDLSFQPSKRLLHEAAQGRLDGLAFRAAQTDRLPGLENLIRVPTPMTHIHLAVYSMDSSLPCFTSWQDIASTQDRFGVHRGHVLADYFVDSLHLSARRIYADSNSQAVALMQAGRIRYFIQTYEVFEPFLRSNTQHSKVFFQGEIASEGVYMFLAPKFKQAVPIANIGILKVTNSQEGILDSFSQEPLHNSKGCRIELW